VGTFIGGELFHDLVFFVASLPRSGLDAYMIFYAPLSRSVEDWVVFPLMQVAHTGGVHKPQSRDVEGASNRPRDNRR
jgi:hypothetical protein